MNQSLIIIFLNFSSLCFKVAWNDHVVSLMRFLPWSCISAWIVASTGHALFPFIPIVPVCLPRCLPCLLRYAVMIGNIQRFLFSWLVSVCSVSCLHVPGVKLLWFGCPTLTLTFDPLRFWLSLGVVGDRVKIRDLLCLAVALAHYFTSVSTLRIILFVTLIWIIMRIMENDVRWETLHNPFMGQTFLRCNPLLWVPLEAPADEIYKCWIRLLSKLCHDVLQSFLFLLLIQNFKGSRDCCIFKLSEKLFSLWIL